MAEAAVYVEAITELNDELIRLENKVVALRAKYDGVENSDADYLAVLDKIKESFEALRLSMEQISMAAHAARSKANDPGTKV